MSLLTRRAQFYRMLATLEDAGLPRVRALQQHFPNPFRRAGRQMAEVIGTEGTTLSNAMSRHPRLFSPFECSLVRVGEQTGRAELVFRALAEWYELVQRLRGEVITGLLYPALVYQFAAVALPAIQWITGGLSFNGMLWRMALMLGVPYLLAFLWFVVKPAFYPAGLPVPPNVARVVLAVPLLGTLVYKLNAARFFHAFGLALQAGMGAAAAVRLAGSSCTNAFLRTRFLTMADIVEQRGCTFTAAFRENLLWRERNSMALAMMDSAELAGAPDTMATKVAQVYREEAEELLKRIAKIAPVLIYLVLALYIASQIVHFYAGYVGQLQGLLE